MVINMNQLLATHYFEKHCYAATGDTLNNAFDPTQGRVTESDKMARTPGTQLSHICCIADLLKLPDGVERIRANGGKFRTKTDNCRHATG